MKKLLIGTVLIGLSLNLQADAVSDTNDACSRGDAKSCVEVGKFYIKYNEYTKAAQAFKKACDGLNPRGCYFLGMAYYNGRGVKQDYGKAKGLFNDVCSVKDLFPSGTFVIDDSCRKYKSL